MTAPAFLALGTVRSGFPHYTAHPDVWLVMASLVLLYWWALTRLGPVAVPPGASIASRGNVVSFVFAVLTLWVFSDYPIHDLAEHYLFSVHMTQHIVYTMVSAPLLLLAVPPWLMHKLLVEPRRIYRIARHVTRPVVALLVFNGFLVITHWPNVTNETTHNEAFHFGMHVLMFGSALIAWMPMINRLPELPRMSYPQRMLYLFLQSIVPTVPGAFLVFASGVVYKAYVGRPELLGFSAIGDQQVAGAIMKLGGGAILWGVLTYTFFKWVAEEQRRDRTRGDAISDMDELGAPEIVLPNVLTWDDVARELERTPPPKSG